MKTLNKVKRKILLKTRLFNRYTAITVAAVFLLGLLSWLFDSGLLPVLWSYGEDVNCSYTEYVTLMWDQILCWEAFIDSMMRYIMFIFPMLPAFCATGFIRELKSYHVLGAIRYENRSREIVKGIAVHTIQSGAAAVLPFLVLIFSVDYLMYPALDSLGGIGLLFTADFYRHHAWIVFSVMVIIYYFPLACAYALMAVSVALLSKDSFAMIVVPELCYIVENFVSYLSKGKLPMDTLDVLAAYNTGKTPGALLLPLVIQLFISFVFCLIAYTIYKKRKLVDA